MDRIMTQSRPALPWNVVYYRLERQREKSPTAVGKDLAKQS